MLKSPLSPATNYIELEGIKVKTIIGVYAYEKKIRQDLLLDLIIPLPIGDFLDKLENTIDYDKLCQTITHFIESEQFDLIETVAQKTIELIQKEFFVPHLLIRVTKPHVLKHVGKVSVVFQV